MATKRKHESTQPKNPLQLTINQHIHSRWCISHFSDERGCVAVSRRGQPLFSVKPEDTIFCAKRVWDENLERGLFRKVESNFHAVAQSILQGERVVDHSAVTAYILVWQLRADLAKTPPEEFVLNGVSESVEVLSRNEEEILEKKGYAFSRGVSVPGRFGAFVPALRTFDSGMLQLKETRWGVLRANESIGFICPDRPANELYFPISPRIALVAGHSDLKVGDVTVNDLNESSKRQSREMVFGHPRDMAAFVSRAVAG